MKTFETKTFEFNAAGLLPLNAEEEQNICGGFWSRIVGGGLVAAGRAIIGDWDNFKAGLMGAPER
jgi:hypothetical protein